MIIMILLYTVIFERQYLKAAFAFGLGCTVFRYWLLKVSSVNYLPSQSYMTELTVELYGVACQIKNL